MNRQLESIARTLAKQPYHMEIHEDETTDDEPIFTVNYLEMPGCRAQGDSVDEAVENLKELTFEYILVYLENGVTVPQPYTTTTATSDNVLKLAPNKKQENQTTETILIH